MAGVVAMAGMAAVSTVLVVIAVALVLDGGGGRKVVVVVMRLAVIHWSDSGRWQGILPTSMPDRLPPVDRQSCR